MSKISKVFDLTNRIIDRDYTTVAQVLKNKGTESVKLNSSINSLRIATLEKKKKKKNVKKEISTNSGIRNST